MAQILHHCPKKFFVHVSCFRFFLYIYTCKNYNSYYTTPIDLILILLDSLKSLISFLQISEYLYLYFTSYEIFKVMYSICLDFKT